MTYKCEGTKQREIGNQDWVSIIKENFNQIPMYNYSRMFPNGTTYVWTK